MAVNHANVYWFLLTFSWIPKFASKSVVGFLVGTGSLVPMLLSSIVQVTIPVALWFSLKEVLPPLNALGWSYGTQDWILALIFVIYFYLSKNLQKTYQLKWMLCSCKSKNNQNNSSDSAEYIEINEEETDDADAAIRDAVSWSNVLRDVVKGGLQLLIVDLSIQLSITITIYIAATQHLSTGYKLAGAQAAYWSFGPSYLVGINMLLKILGSQLMGRGETKKYLIHFIYAIILTVSMAIGAIWLGASMGNGLAYDFGETACIYAGQGKECAQIYVGIFLGDDSLGKLMTNVLGPTVGLQLFFMLIRAGLMAW